VKRNATPLRSGLPLSAKILLWFFANLLLIAIAVYAFAEFEFHIGPETLLGGRAGRRIDALAALVSGEIAAQSPDKWDDVLQRAGNLYGIHLLLAGPDGRRLAGDDLTLPDPVRGALFHPHPPQPPQPPPPAPLRLIPIGPDHPFPPGGPDHDGPPREHRMLHTDNPSRYWLLIAIDSPNPPDQMFPRMPAPPMTLIAESESLGLGGLVLDVTPWLLAAAGVGIFSLLFWLPLVRGITHSIHEMTRATARVAEGRFDVHVRENRRDELGSLAQSINTMTERLSGLVNGQKRFLGDIAHELCSPLARAQVALGILESKLSRGDLTDLEEEVQQMSSLVNELLSFSKASLAAGRIKLDTVPLAEMVRRTMTRENLPADAIRVEIPDDLRVQAEPELLCRALANVLRNAVKYAGAAGPIDAQARRAGDEVLLSITDNGPGVPAEALAQLFDPFYRVDVSRARETGGTGLGLAIVKTCVESCGGRVSCENRDPHGLRVNIRLIAA
jgi:two-component system, OmpR family, sensor histidine kinase CpxA